MNVRACIDMPRPQGGSSGPRQSSGHSYSSRSTSGHRMSSGSAPSSRPGSSQGGSFRPGSNQSFPSSGRQQDPYRSSPLSGLFLGGMLGSMMGRRNQRQYYDPGYPQRPSIPPGYPQQPRRQSAAALSLLWMLLLFFLLMIGFGMCGCSSDGDAPENRYNREKLENSVPYSADCIVDELGFFENPSRTGERLKTFYDQTGIQPYIVIEDYNPALRTDEQKEKFAEDYYNRYINNEDTFLYMYFGEADPNSVGYMAVVNGKNAEPIMDSQAVETFWNYLDQEWTSGKETDDMFVDVYNKTAQRIMTKSTTSNDVAMRALLIGGIVIVAAVIVVLVLLKQKRDREKAEETRRILETPINLNPNDSNDEDLLNRYGG